MYAQNSNSFMQDDDLLNVILADLKRTVREYTTAATESNCPTVRRVFNDLTMDTLRLQGDLYTQMKQMNMYQTPSKALRQDVDKEIQSAHQTYQQTQQFIQQKTGGAASYGASQDAFRRQNDAQHPYYM